MTKVRKKWWILPTIAAFFIYIFITARPITEETILRPRWISSLETELPIYIGNFPNEGFDDIPINISINEQNMTNDFLPFLLGDRFGYIRDDGTFLLNQRRTSYVSISSNYWTEYENLPSQIDIRNPQGNLVLTLEDDSNNTFRSYPIFIDDTILLLDNEQNSITAINTAGTLLWTYDFPAPITCIDSASGYVLAGTLDGAIILISPQGRQVFAPFEPGGSRLSIILGCAISKDASRIAIISGIDEQRFLLLERSGDNYRVIYHEFLGEGFRRPVFINFVDNDNRVAFEREGGLGIYDIASRISTNLPLSGEVLLMDNSGEDRFLFLVTASGGIEKRLIGIRYPSSIIIDIPFRSENVFLSRRENRIFLGGDHSITSFVLDRR